MPMSLKSGRDAQEKRKKLSDGPDGEIGTKRKILVALNSKDTRKKKEKK